MIIHFLDYIGYKFSIDIESPFTWKRNSNDRSILDWKLKGDHIEFESHGIYHGDIYMTDSQKIQLEEEIQKARDVIKFNEQFNKHLSE